MVAHAHFRGRQDCSSWKLVRVTGRLQSRGQPREDSLSTAATHTLTHLQRLEAESIHIMREVVAETENPVMLYSIGKDSAVMLHLAMKAFHPARPPEPP